MQGHFCRCLLFGRESTVDIGRWRAGGGDGRLSLIVIRRVIILIALTWMGMDGLEKEIERETAFILEPRSRGIETLECVGRSRRSVRRKHSLFEDCWKNEEGRKKINQPSERTRN
jgi:hypothetical protein